MCNTRWLHDTRVFISWLNRCVSGLLVTVKRLRDGISNSEWIWRNENGVPSARQSRSTVGDVCCCFYGSASRFCMNRKECDIDMDLARTFPDSSVLTSSWGSLTLTKIRLVCDEKVHPKIYSEDPSARDRENSELLKSRRDCFVNFSSSSLHHVQQSPFKPLRYSINLRLKEMCFSEEMFLAMFLKKKIQFA